MGGSGANFDCVIAAAGGSTRMGTHKLLLPFGPPECRSTMVGTVVDAALEAGCRVLLVVGHRGAEVLEAALDRAAHRGAVDGGLIVVVENSSWELGMLGSIQSALGLVRGEAFFSMNADMPSVPASVYRALAEARDARNKSGLPEAAAFAGSGGREGHPVLIPSAWIPEIMRLPPGGRMRDFLDARPRILVEAGSDAVLEDIDDRAAYERAAARFGRGRA